MFDRYLKLIKAFHVDWFSIKHQCSSIPASSAASRMIYPEHIMLVLRLLCENTSCTLYVMSYICNNSCDEVCQNMSPVDVIASHSLVGMPIMRLHDAS